MVIKRAVISVIAGSCWPSISLAQTDPLQAIEACKTQNANDASRIVCLENALRSLAQPPPAALPGTASPTAGLPDAAASERKSDEAVVASEPAAEIPTIAGIGAEQVRARTERETKEGKNQRKERQSKEAVEAQLIDFARTATGRLILVLDNGQVWAQRGGDQQEVRLREGEKPKLKIRRGAISGYRIEFDSPNVTIVAERLK